MVCGSRHFKGGRLMPRSADLARLRRAIDRNSGRHPFEARRAALGRIHDELWIAELTRRGWDLRPHGPESEKEAAQ